MTRDWAPPLTGSTVIVAFVRMGPSVPRAAQPWGGSLRVICWIIARLAPLIRHNVVLPLGESARIGGDGEDLSGVYAISIVETRVPSAPPCYLCLCSRVSAMTDDGLER